MDNQLQTKTIQLNPEQIRAVKHDEGPLLVLAGAGSGKTRVLTQRIAYLIREKKVSPYNILAITFTNKAANEMKQRVAGQLGRDVRDLWISTFHSACVRILRRHADLIGYSPGFVIYDDADQQTLIKQCMKELDISDKKYSPRIFSAAISDAKNKLIGPEEYQRGAADFQQRQNSSVYNIYQRKIKQNNALDFDDLILETVHLFRTQPDILDLYREKFRYILVDEYQDTNHAQYVLVNLLAKKHRNICVVGDPDQSIYRFRGADIDNILNFEQDYPDAEVITLQQNYRSTRAILQAANSVISNNEMRKDKKLNTENDEGELITHYTGADEYGESRFVANEISRLSREKGYVWSQFAVLYRTHAQSRVLEEALLQSGIPYRIVGGLKFYDRKEIKDLLAYLRVISNPADNISLQRIINVPRRGIGDATLQLLNDFTADQQISLWQCLQQVQWIEGLSTRAVNQLQRFSAVITDLQQDKLMLSCTDLVKQVLARSGYQNMLEQEQSVEAQTRLENIKEFMSVTQLYDEQSEHPDLDEFLAEISLVTDLDKNSDNQENDGTDKDLDNAVVLMSLHSAKGLEFPVVFLTGMEERIFPHSRSLLDQNELEEERRLCYVGITRAQRKLYITNVRKRFLYGTANYNEVSRFIEEIPGDLLEKVDDSDQLSDSSAPSYADALNDLGRGFSGYGTLRRNNRNYYSDHNNVSTPDDHETEYINGSFGVSKRENKKNTDRKISASSGENVRPAGKHAPSMPVPKKNNQTADLMLGDKVRHSKYGEGVVVAVKGSGEDAEVKVAFPAAGIKRFLVQYAALGKIRHD